jgi:hypothetical protein
VAQVSVDTPHVALSKNWGGVVCQSVRNVEGFSLVVLLNCDIRGKKKALMAQNESSTKDNRSGIDVCVERELRGVSW